LNENQAQAKFFVHARRRLLKSTTPRQRPAFSARAEHGFDKITEEFYELLLDPGLNLNTAKSIRGAVKRLRPGMYWQLNASITSTR
jgi:hypothetical protein